MQTENMIYLNRKKYIYNYYNINNTKNKYNNNITTIKIKTTKIIIIKKYNNNKN